MAERTLSQRKRLIKATGSKLSIRAQCLLLGVARSSLYYKAVGESDANLELMRLMDKLFLDDPTLGVLGMQDELREMKQNPNVKRVRRLMRKMRLEPIYPKRNLSKPGKAQYIHPYLLRDLNVVRPNQVWAIDITYIPMKKGFLYLTAVIDLYSRFLVGWQISNSLEKETQTELLTELFERWGKPEIINSDQGSQYTSSNWVDFLKDHQVRISMDGKGRATDNAFIERFFRTLKQRHVYLNPAKDGLELYEGVSRFIYKYNRKRHQGIGRVKPISLFPKAA